MAVTSSRRVPGLPAVPTVGESGLPGFELSTWYGIWGPKGLPRDIAARIQTETARAIGSAEVRQRLPVESFELIASTPEDFARTIELEAAKYSAIVRKANLTAE